MNTLTTNAVPTTIQYMTVVVPLITAVLTFILTSLFTSFKERKAMNIPKRVILDYAEYTFDYPFENKVSENHGNGRILLGSNGKNITNEALDFYKGARTRSPLQFLVLKNVTENNVINVKIRTVYGSKEGEKVDEMFIMPVWEHKTTLYLPQTVYCSKSTFSTNLELVITYTTANFETFKYSYKRTKKNLYKERLKKRYLGFIWLTKIRYFKQSFNSFLVVRSKFGSSDNNQ
ncbi:hypothetical protein QPK24_15650 [Paenibacillus polygoni]|uniref:Uncharacterized protein n=1 Tax=Paenibacillus polygoni TaxID=3050112 RepID=A0ABY8X0P5_9BACL|nr:hypothetical protein [Paenibacillus polygoni]WIV17843.1 hypothetical protein QPK24_15650 [Paenibacillus polygoni]